MRIDGEQLAKEKLSKLTERVAAKGLPAPGIAIVQAGDNSTSARFIEKKQRMAEEVGVRTQVATFPHDVSQTNLINAIAELAHDETHHGIIVQLPLPKHIMIQEVLNAVPLRKDVDALSEGSVEAFAKGALSIAPPVVGAIDFVLSSQNISLSGKHIVVMGQGRLVGKPVVSWLTQKGITPTIIDKNTPDSASKLSKADVLITGIGKPGFITPEHVKDGIVILDAGTTTQAGSLHGDVDPACQQKAQLFTPVPGGLGPLTVATVLENLVVLWSHSH